MMEDGKGGGGGGEDNEKDGKGKEREWKWEVMELNYLNVLPKMSGIYANI